MGVMTTTGLPRGRPFTIDDLETLPDDGNRYELLDGALLVSPAPGWSHQEVGLALYRQLHAQAPPGLRVLAAPFAVTFGTRDTEFQPDVLVTRYDDLRPKNLPAAPLLAVEVRSPSTSLVDLNLKKAAYERFGVLSYWIIDPDEPSLVALDLVDGAYVEVAHAVADESVTFEAPFAVTVNPSDLRRGLEPD